MTPALRVGKCPDNTSFQIILAPSTTLPCGVNGPHLGSCMKTWLYLAPKDLGQSPGDILCVPRYQRVWLVRDTGFIGDHQAQEKGFIWHGPRLALPTIPQMEFQLQAELPEPNLQGQSHPPTMGAA